MSDSGRREPCARQHPPSGDPHVPSRREFLRALAGAGVLGGAVATTGRPAAAQPALVEVHAGALPIVISAPHGGRRVVPGAPPRTMGVTTRDTNTIELAQAAARRLEHVTGARPSMVVAQFDRLYVDANRALDEAIESPIARPVYDDYHASLRGLVEATRQRFPNGALLVDLHGQALMRGHLMRGTRDGLTVTRMLERHGAAALVGPGSVLGRLASGGYPVEPPNTPPPTPREERFNGGYIVAAYGSQHADGIDAIQVEVGSDFRLTAMPREALAVALGDALAWFAAVYLGIASPAFGGRDLRPASFRSHGGSIATGVAAVG